MTRSRSRCRPSPTRRTRRARCSSPARKPDPLLGELTRTMGRAADQTWQEGATRVHAWTHQQGDALSYVHYYAPEKAGAIAVLSASVFVKN